MRDTAEERLLNARAAGGGLFAGQRMDEVWREREEMDLDRYI